MARDAVDKASKEERAAYSKALRVGEPTVVAEERIKWARGIAVSREIEAEAAAAASRPSIDNVHASIMQR